MPRRAIKPDDSIIAPFRQAIAFGHSVRTASTRAGIGKTLAYELIAAGESGSDSHAVAFADAYKAGVAEFAQHNLVRVNESGKGWQASAWLLERRMPAEYSRTPQPATATVNVLNIQVSEPQAARIAAIAAKEWALSEGWRPAIDTSGGAQHALKAAEATPEPDSDTS